MQLSCERCGTELHGSWRSSAINAIQHDFSATPDGTGLHLTPAALLACSWNCLAVLAAERAGATADAAVRIVAERERQVTAEGWSPEHDERHAPGEMVDAAVAYAHRHGKWSPTHLDVQAIDSKGIVPDGWPWEAEWWKPRALAPDLIRAGALIAAELDADRRRHPDPDPVRF